MRGQKHGRLIYQSPTVLPKLRNLKVAFAAIVLEYGGNEAAADPPQLAFLVEEVARTLADLRA